MAMGGEQPDREVQRATAEIADKVQRRHGLARRADRVERARDRDIIDVVPGPVGERTRLAPTGHSPVDKRRVARRAFRSAARSEEHTSELQSLMRISYAVFRLEKKTTLTVL